MHYYSFNIGDYRRRTSHLTLLEHGIYRSLIDTYLLEQKPLCGDVSVIMRTHCIRTANEKRSLNNVLSDFFKLQDGKFHNSRCDEIISSYNEKSEKARESANVRWKKDANAMRTQSEGNANHKPLTNNHKPINKGNSFTPPSLEEITTYCVDRCNSVDPEKLLDHYEANGWYRGKAKIKDWKACVRTWEKSDNQKQQSGYDGVSI